MERQKTAHPVSDGLSALQPLENSLIILGYGAVIVNLFFFLFLISRMLLGKGTGVPRWLLVFNFILFVTQLLYFFVLP